MVEVYDSVIRVLVVDDHEMMRHVIGKVLALDDEIEVSGMAADLEEAITLIKRYPPDLVVLDYALPGGSGIEIMKEMVAEKVERPVLFLSVHRYPHLIKRAREAGARGYLLKQAMTTQLLPAIHSVAEGNTFFRAGSRP